MNVQHFNKIQILEELSLNALPSLQQILYDGWILRFAEGYTKRANSVTPLYPSSEDLTQKIYRCEQVYQSFNLKPIFRLTNISQSRTLDQTLEKLGYQKYCNISVQVKTITAGNALHNDYLTIRRGDRSVTLNNELSEEWLDHFVHAASLPIQHWETLSTILQIIPTQTCYAWLKYRYQFCSCGLGVLENNYLGLFFIITAKKQRRKGHAEQLISTLLNWGQSKGATHAYVQVEAKNLKAINLYNKLGFTEVYQYFYRTKA
ncbi:N-acetyltransferase [Pleurocapsa sp. PCC 7319]|uniref:GNAT family N-acetyltransferase n=1 Tax=Pleurocapsa sp. PCC 7319 TaxID=118161 RepID=UPI000345AF34|nr:GNAT family N-acetyltransferase [Pleurocapsa sp. PCC 7319]